MPEVLTLRAALSDLDQTPEGDLAMLKMLRSGFAGAEVRREDDCRLWELDFVPAD